MSGKSLYSNNGTNSCQYSAPTNSQQKRYVRGVYSYKPVAMSQPQAASIACGCQPNVTFEYTYFYGFSGVYANNTDNNYDTSIPQTIFVTANTPNNTGSITGPATINNEAYDYVMPAGLYKGTISNGTSSFTYLNGLSIPYGGSTGYGAITSVASSSDGNNIIAGFSNNTFRYSTDSGTNWTSYTDLKTTNTTLPTYVAASNDYLIAAFTQNNSLTTYIYTIPISDPSSFIPTPSIYSSYVNSIAIDNNNQVTVPISSGYYIYDAATPSDSMTQYTTNIFSTSLTVNYISQPTTIVGLNNVYNVTYSDGEATNTLNTPSNFMATNISSNSSGTIASTIGENNSTFVYNLYTGSGSTGENYTWSQQNSVPLLGPEYMNYGLTNDNAGNVYISSASSLYQGTPTSGSTQYTWSAGVTAGNITNLTIPNN